MHHAPRAFIIQPCLCYWFFIVGDPENVLNSCWAYFQCKKLFHVITIFNVLHTFQPKAGMWTQNVFQELCSTVIPAINMCTIEEHMLLLERGGIVYYIIRAHQLETRPKQNAASVAIWRAHFGKMHGISVCVAQSISVHIVAWSIFLFYTIWMLKIYRCSSPSIKHTHTHIRTHSKYT